MEKIYNIQALRGIAALLVVCFHLLPIEQKYGTGELILPDFFKHGMFGVDLFFVISGFIMTTVTRGRFNNGAFNNGINAAHFLYHRVSRVYPIYWFYSLLVLIVFFIRPEWVNSAQGNELNILSSFLLWPESTLPLINVGWTLIHEMYFYLVFAVFLAFLPEKKLPLFLLFWGVLVIVFDVCFVTDSPVLLLITHPLTLEFIAGCFLAIYFQKDQGLRLALILVISSIVIWVTLPEIHKAEIPSRWWRVIMYGIPAAAVMYCLVIAERKSFILNKYLFKLGDASYSIYLTHVLVLSAAGRALYAISTSYPISNAALIIILLCLVVVSGVISYRIIERPLLKVSRKLFDRIKTSNQMGS